MTLAAYNGTVTAGGTDGDLVTTANPILLAANRGTVSAPVTVAVRGDSVHHYLCNVLASGTNAERVHLSLDGVNWSQVVMLHQIATTNSLVYLRTDVLEDEDYGDNTAITLVIDSYQSI